MNQTTQLASGTINGSDRLLIELIEPVGQPPIVAITWPTKPTVTTPAQLDTVVAGTMRVLSNSVIELAAIRVWKKLPATTTYAQHADASTPS
jgi:hypothetical protein